MTGSEVGSVGDLGDPSGGLRRRLSLPDPAPQPSASWMRLASIVIALIAIVVLFALAVSYRVAARAADATVVQIAPDLGRIDSGLGFHIVEAEGQSIFSWEFDYGPSGGMGPITMQVIVGMTGEVYPNPAAPSSP